MLDLHVLVSPSTPKDWVQHCLTSIEAARQQCFYRVDIHVCEAVLGHIGQARAAAYAKGAQPYVTFVDDDDWLLHKGLALLRSSLLQKPEAVFGRENTFHAGKIRFNDTRHHLAVYSRDVLIDHSKWKAFGDLAQMNALSGRGVDVLEPGYVRRAYYRADRYANRAIEEFRAATKTGN